MKTTTWKISVGCFFLFLTLIACKKNNSAPAPSIQLNRSEITATAEAATATLEITANVSWKLEVPEVAGWIKADKTSGDAGTTKLTLTIAAHQVATPRSAALLVKGGPQDATRVTLTVIQGKATLKVTPGKLKAKGGQIIEIKGEGFSEVLTENTVTINDQSLTVTHATATTLKVTIPAKIGDGKLKVKVGGQTVDGPDFTYDWVWNVTTLSLNGTLFMPGDLKVDAAGNVYVIEENHNRIKKITPDGSVSIFAGAADGSVGTADGQGSGARFNMPRGLCFGEGGELFVADRENRKIRGINSIGVVRTVTAPPYFPECLFIKDNVMYVGDKVGSRLHSWDGSNDRSLVNTAVKPNSIAIDAAGGLFVADTENNQILKVGADRSLDIWAGSQMGQKGSNDGTGVQAAFDSPRTIVIDAKGNIFVADFGNHKIRMIAPDRTVVTVAGTGVAGSADGPALEATFDHPAGITIDSNGDLFVSDWASFKIRKLSRQ